MSDTDLTGVHYTRLIKENNELRAYLKAFLHAIVIPEENGRDIGVHEANPTMDWSFTMIEDHISGRRITGGQIRRAAELIGHDALKIKPATRTISNDLAETAELRRQREALRATIEGILVAVKGRGSDQTASEALDQIVESNKFDKKFNMQLSRLAKFLDEAVEMGKNTLDQTKKV